MNAGGAITQEPPVDHPPLPPPVTYHEAPEIHDVAIDHEAGTITDTGALPAIVSASLPTARAKCIPKKCEHGRQKSQCKDCHGSGICEHHRERRLCKDCGGSGMFSMLKFVSVVLLVLTERKGGGGFKN